MSLLFLVSSAFAAAAEVGALVVVADIVGGRVVSVAYWSIPSLNNRR